VGKKNLPWIIKAEKAEFSHSFIQVTFLGADEFCSICHPHYSFCASGAETMDTQRSTSDVGAWSNFVSSGGCFRSGIEEHIGNFEECVVNNVTSIRWDKYHNGKCVLT
jgi:hypothetical protein